MSADEIRKIADECEVEITKAKFVYAFAEKSNDEKMMKLAVETEQSERRKSAALLDFAAMVERCEKLKFNMIPHRHDKEIVDYILKGVTDERK